MRKNTVLVFFFLLFLISCLAGCMYTAPSGTPVAAQPSPPPAVTTPEETPGPIITAVPATELARIEQQNLGTDSGTGSMYRFQGILTISGGAYSSVKMIMQYPDGNEYVFDAGEMGEPAPRRRPSSSTRTPVTSTRPRTISSSWTGRSTRRITSTLTGPYTGLLPPIRQCRLPGREPVPFFPDCLFQKAFFRRYRPGFSSRTGRYRGTCRRPGGARRFPSPGSTGRMQPHRSGPPAVHREKRPCR